MEITLIIVIVSIASAYFFLTYKPKQKENLKELYTEGLDLMSMDIGKVHMKILRKLLAKKQIMLKHILN